MTELPKLSSSNIRVFTSVRVKDERRAKAKTDSNVLTIQTLVGFAEKAKVNTLAAENLERVPTTRTSLPLKITIIMMKIWMNLQTPIKPTMTQSIRRRSSRPR